MIPIKVKKADKELIKIASSVRDITEYINKMIANTLGQKYSLDHKINLSLGDKQHYANNPRSNRMYIQFECIKLDNIISDTSKKMYISGILHEIGHSYLRVENSLKRAKESIISEGFAYTFALLFLEDASKQLNANSFLATNNYFEFEEKCYSLIFQQTGQLFPPLELARFFLNAHITKEDMLQIIEEFSLKHKTQKQIEEIIDKVMGSNTRDQYIALFKKFDIFEYGRKCNRKK